MKNNSANILGVSVDKIDLDEAVDLVKGWLLKGGKHYIVTTNIEFIMAARKDATYQRILNKADLSISDSSRLDWAYKILREKNFFKKIALWPFFLAPDLLKRKIPTTPGIDLMENLCKLADDQVFRVGFLGGGEGVADKTAECLQKEYPRLKISFAKSGGRVNQEGEMDDRLALPSCDLLFVAFGQIKQEKWIVRNIDRVDARVFMGVGGAFDYLSGRVPRAPKALRSLGLEWLFRGFIQPWRIKRFFSLLQFIFLVMVC